MDFTPNPTRYFLCIKYEFNKNVLFSKGNESYPFSYGTDGTGGRTDSGDTIYPVPLKCLRRNELGNAVFRHQDKNQYYFFVYGLRMLVKKVLDFRLKTVFVLANI